jgi:coenzyme F420 hydrogenase subunit beta
VTALLYQFLSDGGEGAVVAGLEEDAPWKARPMVVRSKEEVLKGAGTKYTPSPTLVGVASAIQEHDLKKIAVVGTPCQMKALGKIETGARCEAKISEAVKLKIGLFCMETFSYPSFMEYLENEGIDPVKVDKFEIKGGRFIANQGGETIHRVRLSKVKQLVRGCCHSCGDFTAEFSDISAGNVGSPDGWSTVVVRTEVGEKALKAAEKAGLVEIQPVEEGKSGLGLVERLAVKKRKDAEKAGEEE